MSETSEIVKEIVDKVTSDDTNTKEESVLYDTSEIEIDEFLPQFEPVKLSGKNLAQQYVSAFNTGMNVYQCLNYLQGYVYTLVTAMNATIDAWNTVVPLIEQMVRTWTDEEFDFKWEELRPIVIQLCKDTTIETFNKAWEELKPIVIQLCKDTTDEEFDKKWEELRPQVIQLCKDTTIAQFEQTWTEFKPTVIQLCKDTTIEQFEKSWEELKPTLIQLTKDTTIEQFEKSWEELKPTLIQLTKDTTIEQFNTCWDTLKPQVLTLVEETTTTKFNESWETLKPTIVKLAQDTVDEEFATQWEVLKPTIQTTVNTMVESAISDFKSQMWKLVTQDDSFPFLLPENFGAVGDGVTDDTDAFQQCINKSIEVYKGILLSSALGYYIGGVLDCDNALSFYSQGTSIIFAVNSKLDFYYCHGVGFVFEEYNVENNFIKFLTANVASCTFDECYFKNVGSMCQFQLVYSVIFNNCSFSNTSIVLTSISTHAHPDILVAFKNCMFSGCVDDYTPLLISGDNFGQIIFDGCNASYLVTTKDYETYTGANYLVRANGRISITNSHIDELKFGLVYLKQQSYTGTTLQTKLNVDNCLLNGCQSQFTFNDGSGVVTIANTNTNKYPTVSMKNNVIIGGSPSSGNGAIIGGIDNSCGSVYLENNYYSSGQMYPKAKYKTDNIGVIELKLKSSATDTEVLPWAS